MPSSKGKPTDPEVSMQTVCHVVEPRLSVYTWRGRERQAERVVFDDEATAR